jgi:putative endonuclease
MIQGAAGALLRRKELAPDALLGRRGEEAAYWHLRNQGFLMVERNYRPPGLRGEIDLIGWEGDVLVFVEVKSRRAGGFLAPEAVVDRDKERHVVAAAREYRRRANQFSKPFRFDIVSIVVHNVSSSADIEIRHFRDAFREADGLAGNG